MKNKVRNIEGIIYLKRKEVLNKEFYKIFKQVEKKKIKWLI